jgi:DNA polymerase I-like protein with 3'-5' exonuclease and polymerase domains
MNQIQPAIDSLVFEIARDKKALEKAYDILRGSRVLGMDTETGGFVPHKNALWSLQLSDGEYSILVPYNYLKTIGPLQELLLNEEIIKVAHNGKFDEKFLKHNGISLVNLADTMITESLLNAGREFKGKSKLLDLAKKYLGYDMSKAERSDFYDGTFYRENRKNPIKAWTSDRIDYALDDVWVLPPIFHIQQQLLEEAGMSGLSETIEKPLVSVVARMEYLGVALDESKTQEFGNRMQERADGLRQELAVTFEPLWQKHWRPMYANEMKLWNAWEAPYKRLKVKSTKEHAAKLCKEAQWETWEEEIKAAQGKDAKSNLRAARNKYLETCTQEYLRVHKPKLEVLRSEKPLQYPPKERKPINITSNQQLGASLAQAGVYVPNMQKVTLEEMSGQNEVLDLLLDFRKYEKLAKYRTVILEEMNDVTNRIHPDINQIVSTGRFSISSPPLQQIPVRTDEGKELRSCFIAPYGRRIVAADYSAIELVLIGALSKDKNLLEAIRKQEEPDFDLHAWTMSKFLQVPYEDLMKVKDGEHSNTVEAGRARFEQEVQIPDLADAPELQTWFKRLRDVVKTLTYALAYGLSEFGLSRKFHMNIDSAKNMMELFYTAYPGVKKFIHDSGESGFRLGYSVTPLGRRRYYNIPKVPTVQAATKLVLEELAEVDEENRQEWKDIPRVERERLIQST